MITGAREPVVALCIAFGWGRPLAPGQARGFGGFFPHLCWEQFLISRMLLLYGHTNVSVRK